MPLITRRRLLTGLTSTLAVGPFIGCAAQRDLKSDPFTLGVASGDPSTAVSRRGDAPAEAAAGNR